MAKFLALLVALFGVVLLTFFLGLILGLIFSLPVYWLWNGCLVGAIDGVNEITWLQSFGIIVLFNMLFKSTVSTDSKKD